MNDDAGFAVRLLDIHRFQRGSDASTCCTA